MNLKTLGLEELMQSIMKVEQKMSDNESCSQLLDAARKDTPIIDELLGALAMLHGRNSGPKKKHGLAMAEHDLTVFLALRELEGHRSRSARPEAAASKT